MENKKKLLIVVDEQLDFIEGGALPVNGGKAACENTVKYIKENKDKINRVVFTMDCHPSDHVSFKENGGEWPKHCCVKTKGANVYPDVTNTVIESKIKLTVYQKGKNKDVEEYSFLRNSDNITNFVKLLEDNKYDEIEICGICGDVCVSNTLLDLKEVVKDTPIRVILDCTASLDGDNHTIAELAKANNIETIPH